jgi:phosphoserine/homoserine phosphotransferase
MIFAIDLEGVLAPEIWPALGDRFGIADLRLTTRDVADFDALMRRRVEAVRAAGITLRELQTLAHAVEPYLGAREFLTRLRALGQVIVISDTFHEFADPLMTKLGGHNLFANRFAVDAGGLLSGFKLRIRGQKERIVSGFHAAGFKVAAVGDSLNDLSILRACDFPVLFRPVEALRAHFPDAAEAQSLDDALALLERAWRRFESEGEPGGAGG